MKADHVAACTGCKHYRYDRPGKMPSFRPHHLCLNPAVMEVCLVTGRYIERDAYLERQVPDKGITAATGPGSCTRAGFMWEPKPVEPRLSWEQRLQRYFGW